LPGLTAVPSGKRKSAAETCTKPSTTTRARPILSLATPHTPSMIMFHTSSATPSSDVIEPSWSTGTLYRVERRKALAAFMKTRTHMLTSERKRNAMK
jgi:hypothetical protein